jgi:1-deoxy-D-xylulose 5-phosphate reductoisomerase
VAGGAFAGGAIGFGDIPRVVRKMLDVHRVGKIRDIADVLDADGWARTTASEIIEKGKIL